MRVHSRRRTSADATFECTYVLPAENDASQGALRWASCKGRWTQIATGYSGLGSESKESFTSAVRGGTFDEATALDSIFAFDARVEYFYATSAQEKPLASFLSKANTVLAWLFGLPNSWAK